jgi:hypothetical protein
MMRITVRRMRIERGVEMMRMITLKMRKKGGWWKKKKKKKKKQEN